jgi:hypothetical protein
MVLEAKIARRRERKEPTSTAYLNATPRGWRGSRARVHSAVQSDTNFQRNV